MFKILTENDIIIYDFNPKYNDNIEPPDPSDPSDTHEVLTAEKAYQQIKPEFMYKLPDGENLSENEIYILSVFENNKSGYINLDISSTSQLYVDYGYMDEYGEFVFSHTDTLNKNGNINSFNKEVFKVEGSKNIFGCNQLVIKIYGGIITSLSFLEYTDIDFRQAKLNVFDFSAKLPSCTSISGLSLLNLWGFGLYDSENITYISFQDCKSLTSIRDINLSKLINGSLCFSNCNSLVILPSLNLISCINTDSMFSDCWSLKKIELNIPLSISTSNMFTRCYSLKTAEIYTSEELKTSNHMFWECNSLNNINLFNVQAVTNSSYMFYHCFSLYTIPNFEFLSTTNISYMFYQCTSLKFIDSFTAPKAYVCNSVFYNCNYLSCIKNLNICTESTLDLNWQSMFYNCRNLSYIQISDLSNKTVSLNQTFVSTSKLKNIELSFNKITDFMQSFLSSGIINVNIKNLEPYNFSCNQSFYGCTRLKTVVGLDTSLCKIFSNMFYNCSSLEISPNLNTDVATSTYYMFYNCSMMSQIALFNHKNIADMRYMYTGSGILTANIDIQNSNNISSMFAACNKLTNVTINNGDSITDLTFLFSNCVSLIYVNNFKFSNSVTSFEGLFASCESLVNFPILEASNISNFTSTFNNCKKMTVQPNWDYSSMQILKSTFDGCPLNVFPDLDYSLVTNMESAFRNCENMRYDGLPGEYVAYQLTRMESCFYSCASITNNPLATENITNINSAFSGCTSMKRLEKLPTGITTGTFKSSNTLRNIEYAFSGCSSLEYFPTSLDTSNVSSFSNVFRNCSISQVYVYRVVSSDFVAPTLSFQNCSNAIHAFSGCLNMTFTPIKITTNDTMKNLTSCSNMFANCISLERLTYNSDNILKTQVSFNKITSAAGTERMFYNCENLILPIIWDRSGTENTTYSRETFYNMTKQGAFDDFEVGYKTGGKVLGMGNTSFPVSLSEIQRIFSNIPNGLSPSSTIYLPSVAPQEVVTYLSSKGFRIG